MKIYKFYVVVLIVLIPIFASATSTTVWKYNPDPALNKNDWRAEAYYLHNYTSFGLRDSLITSPFHCHEDSHLNAITLGADSDFQPDDGWVLYAADLGNSQGGATPMFVLYNKYTGLMRAFFFKLLRHAYPYFAVQATYSGTSNLLALGEKKAKYTKALDRRNQLGECNITSYFDTNGFTYAWYYIDFNILYDPIARLESLICLKLYAAKKSNINLNFDHRSLVTSSSQKTGDSLRLGKEIIEHYKTPIKLMTGLKKIINGHYLNLTKEQISLEQKKSIMEISDSLGNDDDLFTIANTAYG